MDRSGIKSPAIGCKHSLIKSRTFMAVVIMLLLFLFSGFAAASGDGGQESKGWVATDTYKVMNFSVLAIGLFLLKNPGQLRRKTAPLLPGKARKP